MSPIFKKKMKPDELFERAMAMKQQFDNDQKIALLGVVMISCRGKYRHIGNKIISEILKISTDPVEDLERLLRNVHDDELGEDIVDRIAAYGMETKKVYETLNMIGEKIMFHKGTNKAAKKKARQHYDKYYYEATGGNPLKRPDLPIPLW